MYTPRLPGDSEKNSTISTTPVSGSTIRGSFRRIRRTQAGSAHGSANSIGNQAHGITSTTKKYHGFRWCQAAA